ncbi:unnamed protein product, partial [Mesorhabditis belari]|uniref:Laminin subunit beta-1 n=1 Tax=Mesorhabditis belari TaxID=2138241 RepID=A0AAF3J4S8_9BILA
MFGFGGWVRVFFGTLALLQSIRADDDRCRDRSCYPVTGNLLIGRKQQLSTTSTCGLTGRQRFCIVSHLEDSTKCFYCDSRQPWSPNRDPGRMSHRVENVVTEAFEDKTRSWWQSENGQQNVSIRLDLEAEFHFTHLIMTFKSFRPAAMIIERSADFGKTWLPYRYFAYDCANTYPDVVEGNPTKHADVICTSQYSDVSPSTGGEIVYKVLSPHIHTDDPYSQETSQLLKITNLRFNFTKLHTLGDDLLDYRPEIDEKYYYAIYEIVVRGSCSCYGHASRCIPIEGSDPNFNRPDIVHGRCECMHNTEGLNCERCRDFYNDMPWRPAVGTETHECKRCECNGHAARCHFDRGVFESSGQVSGGVCDDCMHNTQGTHCEQCKPYFYRDPLRPIYDPNVCLACQCDKIGSLYDGICEGEQDESRGLVAGKCYCKKNVDGSRCDRCKNGFWNLTDENQDGCIPCSCNLQGTYNNEGCDKYTGKCTCKRLVTGENCNQCLPEHYGLSDDVDGCKACDCDIGGSMDNTCDITTGQCECRDGFSGRRCDKADNSRFCANIDYHTYEAEWANLTYAEIEVRERPDNERDLTWTGEGFARVNERSQIGFKITNLYQSQEYNIVIRYDGQRDPVGWENVQITIIRPDDPNPEGPCKNANPSDDFLIARLHPGGRYAEIRPAVCLEAGVDYEIRVQFGEKRTGIVNDRSAFMLIDSIVLAPPTESLSVFSSTPRGQQHKTEYDRYQCRNVALSLTPLKDYSEVCAKYICPVAAMAFNKSLDCDCDQTGSVSGVCNPRGGQCECKPNVVGRRCDQCAVGTYGFGPSGCSICACDSVGSLHNQCDKQSGQCLCREKGIYGRQCNQCQPGFWSFPDCRVCQCNGHANICDQQSGACIECRNLTAGHYCDRCQDGYYGDPRLGVGLACKPCPCPGGPSSGYQHADTCFLTRVNGSQDVHCNCKPGYVGERCAECAVNHWGNPTAVGEECVRCECNGNIDMGIEGSCNKETGECLKCLYNTEGAQCENCVSGYFGDAKIRSCQRCVCNHLGTNATAGACDRITGQCPCYPNVIGGQCDQCAENHYNLASGEGCSSCECDSNGVMMDHAGNPQLQCHLFDGKCNCKQGRGGRTCSECEDLFWGDPTKADGCKLCECNAQGSATAQCHRNNGTCICLPGSGGPLCNECARGYTGQWPYCQPCGECFHQWDGIVQGLKSKVETLINTANNIEDTGVASAYDEKFEKMEAELAETKKKLEEANISQEHLDDLEKKIDRLRGLMTKARDRLDSVESIVVNATQTVDFAEEDLKSMEGDAERLTAKSMDLQEKANKIKEADVQGAYNITKESAQKSLTAQRRVDAAMSKVAEAETQATATEQLMEKNREDFDEQYAQNEKQLQESEQAVNILEAALPELNKQVCGAAAAPCDALCGGPGGKCGGICGGKSCMDGAVSKAEQAKSFAIEADSKLNDKQKESEQVLTLVRDVLSVTDAAKREAEETLRIAKDAANRANTTKNELDSMVGEMEDFISSNRSSPEQVRALAEEVLKMEISLKPDQIDELAKKIHEALGKINNIELILRETKADKQKATTLEEQARRAEERANVIKNTTETVREALKVAEEVQKTAQQAIKDAEEKMEKARENLAAARQETENAEGKAKSANETMAKIEADLKQVRVQYLQISDDAKAAYNSVDKAQQAAATAEAQNRQMKNDMETARKLLSERTEGNEAPQKRAEDLRQRASKLLYKAKKYNGDISSLTKDSTELQLADYMQTLDELNKRLESVQRDIDRRIDWYINCEQGQTYHPVY